MNDGNLAKKRQQALDQVLQQQLQSVSASFEPTQEPVKRASRPVSWHPSSYTQQHYATQMQMHHQTPQFSYMQQSDYYVGYQHYPPTPVAYSGQTSPVSAYSPTPLPYLNSTQPQPTPTYVGVDVWMDANTHVAYNGSNISPVATEPFPSYTGQSTFAWETPAAVAAPTTGFNSCTAPPTPDNFQPVAQPQAAAVPHEDAITYRPLEEPEEEEGEILVGMGLYDTPDKSDTDPELDNYRTSTSQLLGTTYRKGMMLEAAWEPPAKDDDDDDDEEDADGDDN